MKSKIKNYFSVGAIISAVNLAGGMVYIVNNYYVPFQTAFGFNDAQIGYLITIVGSLSLIMYLPSGYLTDKFKVKNLLVTGLGLTVFLGMIVSFLPNYQTMKVIYALYSITAVLLIFAAYVKAPRLICEDDELAKVTGISVFIGQAFSAAISFFCVWLLKVIPQQAVAFQWIVRSICIVVLMLIVVVLLLFKPLPGNESAQKHEKIKLRDYLEVLKYKKIWYICIYSFAGYLAYAALIYDVPYLVYGLGMDVTLASALGVIETFVLAAAAAPVLGFWANKIKSTVTVLFISMLISLACFIFLTITPREPSLMIFFVVVFLLATFCSAGIWEMMYVPIAEINIPVRVGGMAIGVVSMFAYIVNAFFYAMAGNWLEKYGLNGYTKVFIFSAVCLLIGSVILGLLAYELKKEKGAR